MIDQAVVMYIEVMCLNTLVFVDGESYFLPDPMYSIPSSICYNYRELDEEMFIANILTADGKYMSELPLPCLKDLQC